MIWKIQVYAARIKSITYLEGISEPYEILMGFQEPLFEMDSEV